MPGLKAKSLQTAAAGFYRQDAQPVTQSTA